MNRYQNHVPAVALISLGLLVAAPARAASLTQVNRTDWLGSVNLPSYLQMHIYVPTNKAAKPPIVVSAHSCGSTADGQMGNIPKFLAAADKNGFILVLPDNPGQNCWDVGSDKSLKHDGGGDTQGVALMVKYALTKYAGDASRVYIFGGSSGGMLTQAMLAVYPDVFRAGSARAGVPAGCWAERYDLDGTRQWSVPCAKGQVTHTPQEWGDMVRTMYPGYTGRRPRVQLIQGGNDNTISSVNMPESIDEWTNVLGLSLTPTSSDKGYQGQVSSYDRQFWKNSCGFTVLESWVAPGKDHSMGYEEDAMLKFFGLDVAGGADPEPDCSGDAGVGGTGGATSTGGASSTGGTKNNGGTSSAGGTKSTGIVSSTGGTNSTGGASSTAKTSSAGGTKATGGNTSAGGTKASGGTTSTGGMMSTGSTALVTGGANATTGGAMNTGGSSLMAGGTTSAGGANGTGGNANVSGTANIGGAAAGAVATGGLENSAGTSTSQGSCGCRVVGLPSRSSTLAGASLLGLLLLRSRRRRQSR
jgi:acetylxylan esterase